ncbi:SusC/RagA family TonB-linked outer membrane protein [Bacteroidia bacterium]|nr:SusC/RagA family TonB-linked outer membrane protein [Bacteroidia bacterium]
MLATNGNAQNAVVNLSSNQLTMAQLIEEIEKQTDYLVVYSNSEMNTSKNLTLKNKSAKVSDILQEVFGNEEMKYEFENNYIILSKRAITLNNQQDPGKRITGTVIDDKGEPIIGASISEKGTRNGIATNLEGKFSLQVSPDAILVITYIGYSAQEITIGNQTNLNITLIENSLALDEVVVVGYGSIEKRRVTSAIASVKSENFIKVPTPDAAQMIRGQVAGLAVISPDANPTSTSQLLLRGITTLRSSTSPLILIDGIPGDLRTVSPDEIEQIDVLKDGSAAAIYGSRGTNGVIIITTKNAKGEVPTTVEVNTYLSTQQISRKLPFLTLDQYLDKVAQGLPGAQDNGGRVNWLDEVLQTPLTQVYNISLRGGSRTTNYTAGFDYRDMNGIMKRSNNRMIYPRIEVTHRMFDNKLRINAGLNGYQQKYFDGANGGSFNNAVYRNALTFSPADPIKDANGVWYQSPGKTDYSNPLALLMEVEGEDKATNLRMYANVTFTPIAGLDIKYLVSSNTYNLTQGYYETQKHLSTVRDNRNGFAALGTTRTADDLSELTASYNKTLFNDHTFTVLGGYSWMRNNHQNYWINNWDFPSDDYTYNSIQSGQALANGRASIASAQRENKLIGYFGRLNYNYKGKYMLSASVRYEGSSKFGVDHKWGTFPAVSVGWNLKGEDFLKDVSFLSNLKLRGGFGITGTEPLDPYMSLNTLSFGDYANMNGTWVKSIRPNSNSNADLRWEKKEETNIGLDFGFFDERLSGSIDYYNRDTKDLIWNYTVPSPPYLFSSMVANAGSMRNRGIEVTLQAIPVQTKDFQWVTNANYSTNKNTLLSLSNEKFISSGYSDQGSTGEPIQQTTHRIKEGQPIGNFYGFKSVDIDENGFWIIEGEDGTPKPILQQQPTDKKVIGNGLPKHYLNWNNSISYKNFDLGVTMRGAFRFQILNMPELQYAYPIMLTRGNVLQKAFDNVYGKRPLAVNQELQYVSYYIQDGDYWKIDQLTFGYTLNVKSKWIERFRIYGSISNLAVLTGYSGIDPEVGISGLAPGVDDKNRYPAARTFTLGASFKF